MIFKIYLVSISILLVLMSSCQPTQSLQTSHEPTPYTENLEASYGSIIIAKQDLRHMEWDKNHLVETGKANKALKIVAPPKRRQKKISGQVLTGLVIFGLGVLIIIFAGEDLYLVGTILTLVGAGLALFGLI